MDLSALQKPGLLSYIFNVIAMDPSPYIRRNLLKIFTAGLGSLAIFGTKKVTQERALQSSFGEMIVEEENGETMGETAMLRKKELAREGIVGAMKALKEELGGDKMFSDALWNAIGYVDFCGFTTSDCYLTDMCYKITGARHHGATRTTGHMPDSLRHQNFPDGYPEIAESPDL